MNRRIWVELTAAKLLRFVIAFFLLVLAGRTFDASGQTETNLYFFGSSRGDGNSPRAGLAQGSDGNFYGTATGGGTNNNGTVFRISPGGTYTNLYSFGSEPNDGSDPQAGLAQGSDGNFYGTTYYGGTNSGHGYNGTVFRISPSGAYTNLYSFVGSPTDGANPDGGLVQGSDGNYYGTTRGGGTKGYGTVFRISPSGTYTTLYSFVGSPTDGAFPHAGLVQGSDGNFYGTTYEGGTSANCGSQGCGTAFRISPSGSETNLHSFVGSPDGWTPEAGLVQGSDGNFYGTTLINVFRISPSGSYTNLYSFGSLPDGSDSQAGLVQGSDGNFYGTTVVGGTHNRGTVFGISPSGTYTTLYSFGSSPNDGLDPEAGLVQGGDGNFYGTTLTTVFRVSVPLNPPPYPINQITGVQLSGTNVVFSVVSIAYETYQLQFTSDLTTGNWSNVPGVSVTNSIGALLTLTNFGGAIGPQGFYRFDITP